MGLEDSLPALFPHCSPGWPGQHLKPSSWELRWGLGGVQFQTHLPPLVALILVNQKNGLQSCPANQLVGQGKGSPNGWLSRSQCSPSLPLPWREGVRESRELWDTGCPQHLIDVHSHSTVCERGEFSPVARGKLSCRRDISFCKKAPEWLYGAFVPGERLFS